MGLISKTVSQCIMKVQSRQCSALHLQTTLVIIWENENVKRRYRWGFSKSGLKMFKGTWSLVTFSSLECQWTNDLIPDLRSWFRDLMSHDLITLHSIRCPWMLWLSAPSLVRSTWKENSGLEVAHKKLARAHTQMQIFICGIYNVSETDTEQGWTQQANSVPLWILLALDYRCALWHEIMFQRVHFVLICAALTTQFLHVCSFYAVLHCKIWSCEQSKWELCSDLQGSLEVLNLEKCMIQKKETKSLTQSYEMSDSQANPHFRNKYLLLDLIQNMPCIYALCHGKFGTRCLSNPASHYLTLMIDILCSPWLNTISSFGIFIKLSLNKKHLPPPQKTFLYQRWGWWQSGST